MSTARTAVRWTISVGLIFWLVSKLDWNAVVMLLSGADYWLCFWAVFAGLVLITGVASRLWLILRWRGLAVPWIVVWRVTWTGQFLNGVLPGSTGGDLYKIYAITSQLTGRSTDGAAAVMADRLYALLALIILAGVSMIGARVPWLEFMSGNLAVRAGLLAGALLIGAGLAGCWYWRRELSVKSEKLGRILSMVEVTIRQVASYFCRIEIVVLFLSAAVIVHLGNFLVVFLLTRSLHLSFGFADVLALMPVLMLLLLLPVTVNGHGLREVILIGFFGWMGVSREASSSSFRELAIAFSVMLVACDLVCNLPGGFWSLWHRRQRSSVGVPYIRPPSIS